MYRILLTDSDAERAQTLRDALIESGFDVVTAAGAAETREMFAFVRPEILVVDDELQDGSGSELCCELKATPLGGECAFVLAGDEVCDQVDACLSRPLQAADLLTWCEQRLPDDEAAGDIAGEDPTTGPLEPVSADTSGEQEAPAAGAETAGDEAVQAEAEPAADEAVVAHMPDAVAEEFLEEAVTEMVAEADAATIAMDVVTAGAVQAAAGPGGGADTGEDIADHLDTLFSGSAKPAQRAPAKLSPPVEIHTTDIDLPEKNIPSHAVEPSPPRRQAAAPPAEPRGAAPRVEAPEPQPVAATPSVADPAPAVADLPSRGPASAPSVVKAPTPRRTESNGFPRWMIGVAAAGLMLAVAGWIFLGGDRSGASGEAGEIARNNTTPSATETARPAATAVPVPATVEPVAPVDPAVSPAEASAIPAPAAETEPVFPAPAEATTDGGNVTSVASASGVGTTDAAAVAAAQTPVTAQTPPIEVAAVDTAPVETAAPQETAVVEPPAPKPRFTVEPDAVTAPEPAAAAGFVSPVLLERPQPVFGDALQADTEGALVLSLLVEADGSVARVIVDRTIADTAVEQLAIDAVGGWRYRAAMQDGNPVSAWTTARFVF